MKELHGREVLRTLAETYKQLYLVPAEGAKEKYLDIVLKGREPEKYDLSHFITDKEDHLMPEDTPAGTLAVITLGRREDFITFLRIMVHRCALADIPDTQGAWKTTRNLTTRLSTGSAAYWTAFPQSWQTRGMPGRTISPSGWRNKRKLSGNSGIAMHAIINHIIIIRVGGVLCQREKIRS